LPCSPRTYGPEKERKIRENRQSLCDISAAVEPEGESFEIPIISETEAALGAMNAVLTLSEMFSEFSSSKLVGITNEIVDESFSKDFFPLDGLY
jgi:hypothetical protein